MAKKANKATPDSSPMIPETAAKVETVNWTGGAKVHAGKYGVIDLRTLTVMQAEILIQRGFTLLRMKEIDAVEEEE